MDNERARRVKGEVVRLCQSALDSASLAVQVEGLLRTVIPFDRACWHNVDPATSILTSVMGASAPADPMLPILEYGTLDVNQYVDLALAQMPAAGLRLATRGEPSASRRYREILSGMAVEDELTASFVIGSVFWGCARLYRTQRWQPFDADEVRFIASLCPALAEGFRSALVAPSISVHDTLDGPGVLVLDDEGRPESITPGVERWLREIIDTVPGENGLLPRPVHAVAARARAIAAGDEANRSLARCRVPTRSGRWLVLHGAQMQGGPEGRTAVVIEPAGAAELAPLIVRAYGLTEREREVAQYALKGLATKEIARLLRLSPYTVSDHLRVVFEKVSVKSRTELASRIFFEQYYPRIGRGELIGQDGWFIDWP